MNQNSKRIEPDTSEQTDSSETSVLWLADQETRRTSRNVQFVELGSRNQFNKHLTELAVLEAELSASTKLVTDTEVRYGWGDVANTGSTAEGASNNSRLPIYFELQSDTIEVVTV